MHKAQCCNCHRPKLTSSCFKYTNKTKKGHTTIKHIKANPQECTKIASLHLLFSGFSVLWLDGQAAAYPVNMPDPIHTQASAWKHWPEADRMILAHWLASRPDLFGQNLTQPEPNWIQAGSAQYDPGPQQSVNVGIWKQAGCIRPETGPNDSSISACFQTRCIFPKPDQAIQIRPPISFSQLDAGSWIRHIRSSLILATRWP